MSAEEMVLEPWSFRGDGARAAAHERARALGTRVPAPRVPPVRTIVLNREPTPVRPVREREAVRVASRRPAPSGCGCAT